MFPVPCVQPIRRGLLPLRVTRVFVSYSGNGSLLSHVSFFLFWLILVFGFVVCDSRGCRANILFLRIHNLPFPPSYTTLAEARVSVATSRIFCPHSPCHFRLYGSTTHPPCLLLGGRLFTPFRSLTIQWFHLGSLHFHFGFSSLQFSRCLLVFWALSSVGSYSWLPLTEDFSRDFFVSFALRVPTHEASHLLVCHSWDASANMASFLC